MESEKKTDEELVKIRKKKLKKMYNNLKKPIKTEIIEPKPGKNLIQLNTSNFWDVIKKNERVIVDFYADWCGPCKMLEPIFTQLAKNYRNIIFGRLNTDYETKITIQFQIQAIPLIIFFKQGQVLNKLLGMQTYNTLESHIQKFML